MSIDSASRRSPIWRPRGSVAASPSRIERLCCATQPVSPSPIATRSMSGVGMPIPANSPWNAIGSHMPAASSIA